MKMGVALYNSKNFQKTLVDKAFFTLAFPWGWLVQRKCIEIRTLTLGAIKSLSIDIDIHILHNECLYCINT